MRTLKFLKTFNSPFKRPKLKFYLGKISVGTPYFYPRRWVKATPKLAHKATLEYIEDTENYNRRNPAYAHKIKSYDEIYQEKLGYTYPVPKKIGFDFVSLGYKTKWHETDYRFEWRPVWSFVFYKWQIALMFIAPEEHHYWEAWLYYENNTDKTKTIAERIEDCKNNFSLKCDVYRNDIKETVDYYNNILKKEYLKN